MERSPSPIAAVFGLGRPTEPLVAIAGGPSAGYRLWRLSTAQGRFVVKALGQDPPADGDPAALEGPTRLELAAWAAGVPMPRSMSGPRDRCWRGRDHRAGVAVAAGAGPRVGGRCHPTAPATEELAAALGGALAALHRLRVHCGPDAQVDPWYRAAHGAAHWCRLADRAAQAGRSWARRLDAAPPLLAEVAALVAARGAEVVPLRVCHSDLVPGNVLVSADGRPVLLDWDDAGPWNTTEELAAAVVSWSTGPRASRASRSRSPWSRATSGPGTRSPRPSMSWLGG